MATESKPEYPPDHALLSGGWILEVQIGAGGAPDYLYRDPVGGECYPSGTATEMRHRRALAAIPTAPACAICCRPAGEDHDLLMHKAVAVEAMTKAIARSFEGRCPICTYRSCDETHKRIATEALRQAAERSR